jgi:hypothetical protein
MQCAAHPAIETELTCSKCEKPICPRCAVQTPVGMRCRECANIRRIPTYNLSAGLAARGIGAALGSGLALGIVWWIFNPIAAIFYGILAGIVIGSAIGEAVSLAANKRAGPPMQAMAIGGIVLAYVVRTTALLTVGSWAFSDVRIDLAGLIAFGVGAFVASGRLR